eukprot:gene23919-32317_t
MTTITDDANPIQLKLLTIGDSGVGKSWLLLRWAGENGKFSKSAQSMPTIGIDFKMKNVNINGKRVKVQIWDTAGQERFRTITTSYYRNSQGILLVYDITDRNSFLNMRTWVAQIQSNADVNINKILVGNKCDLIQQRAVSFEEGQALAKEFKVPFMETSAMNDINVEEVFMKISKDVYSRLEGEAGSKGAGSGGIKGSKLSSKSGPKSLSSADQSGAQKPVSRGWC